MPYTLKSNATTANAKVVFVGENGLANLVSGGGAVTATGTMATTTVEGKTVYGSGQTTTGNYLQVASVPAIPSGASKWCVLLVGNFGSNVSGDTGLFAVGPGQTTWVGTVTGPVRTAAQHGGVGGPYGGATVTGYSHPASASVLHAMIYGRDTGPTVLSSYYNGTRSADYSGAFAADGSVATGAWRFGGRPHTGTGGFGIGIFAIFIGTSPSELAAYIAANGTGATEADKVYSALLDAGASGVTGDSSITLGAITGTASGTVSTAGSVTGSSAITLGAVGSSAAGTVTAFATFTSEPLKTNNGTLQASLALDWVRLYNVTTGALVVTKTGISTNSSGVFTVTDAALTVGQTYKADWKITATGETRMPSKAAA